MKILRKAAVCFALIFALALSACGAAPGVTLPDPDADVTSTPEPTPEPTPTPDPVKVRAEELLSGMTLREKLCQLMIVRPEVLTGESPVTAAGETTRLALETYPVGGLIYSVDNLVTQEQTREMITNTQSYSKLPLFISADEEGGNVGRLMYKLGTTWVNSMYSYKDEGADTAYSNAKTIGTDMVSCLFNTDFAPVADVWTNPDNTVIGDRAYSDDFEQAAELVASAVRGFTDAGVICCLKHFPGHGDTAVDSHLGLPLVEKGREALEACELRPFRRTIAAGIPAIMTSHVLFPHLEPERLPATMSRRILTGLLREELGFSGLVISDCMEMQAIAKFYGTVEGAVASLAAGADIVCISHTAALSSQLAERLCTELAEGARSEAEFTASVQRISAAKRRLAEWKEPSCSPERDTGEARRLLERSFTLVHGPLPALGEHTFFVGCGPVRVNLASSHVRETPPFPGFMASALGGCALETSDNPDAGEIERAVREAGKGSCIVLGTCNAHLRPGQTALMRALGEMGRPMIVVALRNPYDLLYLPEGAAGIAVWEYTTRSLEALIPFLLGERAFHGRMPLANTVF